MGYVNRKKGDYIHGNDNKTGIIHSAVRRISLIHRLKNNPNVIRFFTGKDITFVIFIKEKALKPASIRGFQGFYAADRGIEPRL